MRSLALLVALLVACQGGESLEPARGRTGGGDPVHISGSDFARHGPPIVYFGARAAKQVVVESDRVITVITPEAEGPGLVDVAIHYPDGTVFDRPQSFTYEQQGLVLRSDDR